MKDKFIVRKKDIEKKEDKSIVMTLRLDRELQEAFNTLSATMMVKVTDQEMN